MTNGGICFKIAEQKRGIVMKLLKLQNKEIEESLKPIDAESLRKLANVALKCYPNIEEGVVRDILYQSKYQATGLEAKEKDLENYLELVKKTFNVDTKNQGTWYNHVDTNINNMKNIYYRFYIAPRPDNIHELVKELAKLFGLYNVPIKFKYQLTSGMEHCDRIIIYVDKPYRDLVEQIILNIYKRKPYLFTGAERAAAWIYDTKIPGVYMSTGCPTSSYGDDVCKTIREVKDTIRYLYGITSSNPAVSFKGESVNKVYRDVEMIIASTMLRNGLLLSKEDIMVRVPENFDVEYHYDTGILTHYFSDNTGINYVNFLPNTFGRKTLIDNYYFATDVKPQVGVKIEHLTFEEYQRKSYEEYQNKVAELYGNPNKKRK